MAQSSRPPARTYIAFVKVDGDAVLGKFKITSAPYPLHWATVVKQGSPRDGWCWKVTFPTIAHAGPIVEADMSRALNRAADLVGRRAGADMQRYNPAQRLAMGQGKCPFLPIGGRQLCQQAPEVGTVWCADHKGGESQW